MLAVILVIVGRDSSADWLERELCLLASCKCDTVKPKAVQCEDGGLAAS